MRDDAPANKGCKTVPVGKAGCLAGKTFVVTGTQVCTTLHLASGRHGMG